MTVSNSLTITIASGKGGTGKTTIATNLAYALKDNLFVQLIDCDVEEPNSHLFLRPFFDLTEEVGINVPFVDKEKCLGCGKCSKFCAYNALAVIGQEVLIFEELCHGCGGCTLICPVGAISEKKKIIGWIDRGTVQGIEFLQGRLKVGTPLAPPIIKELKKIISKEKLTIIDAPPGTSCSVVASLYGSDYVILVTEPTPFGLHDLKLAYQVVKKINLPCGVIINRSGLVEEEDGSQIEKFCAHESIPILMKIPFKKDYATCYAKGELLAEKFSFLKEEFQQLFSKIVEGLQ